MLRDAKEAERVMAEVNRSLRADEFFRRLVCLDEDLREASELLACGEDFIGGPPSLHPNAKEVASNLVALIQLATEIEEGGE